MFTAHLADIDTRALEIRPIPTRVWISGHTSPVDHLAAYGARLPDPPPALPPTRFADSPAGVAAAVFLFEGYTVAEDDLTDNELRRRQGAAPAGQALPQGRIRNAPT